MQYGNDFDVKAKGLRLTSLNRTMQYGNSNDEIDEEINKQSLNRTMQYGNHIFDILGALAKRV